MAAFVCRRWGRHCDEARGQLIMFPLFHMAAWTFALNAWSAHAPAHFVARADAPELIDAMRRHSPGALYCIPAVWNRILDEAAPDCLDWAEIGTSRVDPNLLKDIVRAFPRAKVTVSYGSTESGGALRLRHEDMFSRPGSVGLPVPGFSARIAENGQLLVASETLMSGYFDLPHETARALVDGWYHSGDLAEQDEDGYFSIIGRTQELIRSGGEWVTPVEVEGALATHPDLEDVAVVGVPDNDWGEVVCAVIVLREGAEVPTIEALRGHVADRLVPYKHPRRVIVVDRIPRTAATGQVQRSLVLSQELIK